MKKTLAAHFSSLIAAIRNCEKTGNAEWLAKHKYVLDYLSVVHLPSGAGIDGSTKILMEKSTPEKIVLATAFHHMNSDGFYTGWTEHRVTVQASLLYGVTLKISGPNRNQIKDYLHEVFQQALTQMLEEPKGAYEAA